MLNQMLNLGPIGGIRTERDRNMVCRWINRDLLFLVITQDQLEDDGRKILGQCPLIPPSHRGVAWPFMVLPPSVQPSHQGVKVKHANPSYDHLILEQIWCSSSVSIMDVIPRHDRHSGDCLDLLSAVRVQ